MNNRRFVAVLLITAAALFVAWVVLQGQPRQVPDAGGSRIACLSYAAFRLPGETPLDPTQTVSEARLEADLRFLSSHTNCVRSYSSGQGMEALPRVAQKLGMQVLLGIWIGRDDRLNDKEIARGIEAARAYPDTVRAVVVGNEVLLRGEQPAEALAKYIARVRAAVPQPVTYADVWEFWLRNAQLAEAASFVTVHILPFWEDNPVPIDFAVDHVLSIYDKVKTHFPNHDVLIGETGWPSVGRDRQGALPSRVNAARFVRGVMTAAEQRGIRYNIVEAFDQPWKRQLEGAVGGYWGIFASDGSPKFLLRGPVVEEPHWQIGVGAAGTLAMLFLLGGIGRRRAGLWGRIGLLAIGCCAGVALAVQARTLWLTCRTPLEWGIGIAFGLASLIAALALARVIADWLDGAGLDGVPPVAEFRQADGRWLAAWRVVLLFGVAASDMLLAFDSRYRDFPIEWLIVPAAGYLIVALAGTNQLGADDREERLLAWLIALSLPVMLWVEGTRNLYGLVWIALCALFAGSVLLARVGGRTRGSYQYQ